LNKEGKNGGLRRYLLQQTHVIENLEEDGAFYQPREKKSFSLYGIDVKRCGDRYYLSASSGLCDQEQHSASKRAGNLASARSNSFSYNNSGDKRKIFCLHRDHGGGWNVPRFKKRRLSSPSEFESFLLQ
jgi:hypothetical protein